MNITRSTFLRCVWPRDDDVGGEDCVDAMVALYFSSMKKKKKTQYRRDRNSLSKPNS